MERSRIDPNKNLRRNYSDGDEIVNSTLEMVKKELSKLMKLVLGKILTLQKVKQFTFLVNKVFRPEFDLEIKVR